MLERDRKECIHFPFSLQTYNLQLTAYDNAKVHSATTSVVIQVLDENDNPPIFDSSEYEVEDLVDEEDDSINLNNPKFLVTVRIFMRS